MLQSASHGWSGIDHLKLEWSTYVLLVPVVEGRFQCCHCKL